MLPARELLFCGGKKETMARRTIVSEKLKTSLGRQGYFFKPLNSSEIVSFLRPFARRAANTRRPLAVAILSRKPCLFFLFLKEGWNVLFILLSFYYVILKSTNRDAKVACFFLTAKSSCFFFSVFCFFATDELFLCPKKENWY